MAVSEYTKYTVNRHCFFCEKISRRRFVADLFTHKWAMAVSEYTKYTVNRQSFFCKKLWLTISNAINLCHPERSRKAAESKDLRSMVTLLGIGGAEIPPRGCALVGMTGRYGGAVMKTVLHPSAQCAHWAPPLGGEALGCGGETVSLPPSKPAFHAGFATSLIRGRQGVRRMRADVHQSAPAG